MGNNQTRRGGRSGRGGHSEGGRGRGHGFRNAVGNLTHRRRHAEPANSQPQPQPVSTQEGPTEDHFPAWTNPASASFATASASAQLPPYEAQEQNAPFAINPLPSLPTWLPPARRPVTAQGTVTLRSDFTLKSSVDTMNANYITQGGGPADGPTQFNFLRRRAMTGEYHPGLLIAQCILRGQTKGTITFADRTRHSMTFEEYQVTWLGDQSHIDQVFEFPDSSGRLTGEPSTMYLGYFPNWQPGPARRFQKLLVHDLIQNEGSTLPTSETLLLMRGVNPIGPPEDPQASHASYD